MPDTVRDYEELLRLFNKHRVRYCVVGAYAVAFHAIPRFTKDLDILVEPSTRNGVGILQALKAFGFGAVSTYRVRFQSTGSCHSAWV